MDLAVSEINSFTALFYLLSDSTDIFFMSVLSSFLFSSHALLYLKDFHLDTISNFHLPILTLFNRANN